MFNALTILDHNSYLYKQTHFLFITDFLFYYLQVDPRYEVTQDVRAQLKFLEDLDKVERKRHEEQERELLLRAAKSRAKTEDPEQAKLKAKAKEVVYKYLYFIFLYNSCLTFVQFSFACIKLLY